MTKIVCTPKLEEIGPLEPIRYTGSTVGAVLDAAGKDYPRLKNYILDDQGRVRKHIAIFINGELRSRERVLEYAVGDVDEICIMQALSGG